MNPKITRLREELTKNKEKITALQGRNRELEKQIRELENIDIIGMVRARGLSLEDFAALLQTLNKPAPTTTSPKMEESDYEET